MAKKNKRVLDPPQASIAINDLRRFFQETQPPEAAERFFRLVQPPPELATKLNLAVPVDEKLAALFNSVKIPADHPIMQALAAFEKHREREIEQRIEEERRRQGGSPRKLKLDQIKDAQEKLKRARQNDPKLLVRKNATDFAAKLLKVSSSTAWRYVVKPVLPPRSR